jgi:hypothetical protein
MRKIIGGVVFAFVVLSSVGCGERSMEREMVDGVECVVIRHGISHKPEAVDCNWDDLDE